MNIYDRLDTKMVDWLTFRPILFNISAICESNKTRWIVVFVFKNQKHTSVLVELIGEFKSIVLKFNAFKFKYIVSHVVLLVSKENIQMIYR